MAQTNPKSVVVVGGGAAGATITRTLSAKLKASIATLTLITARPFALHFPAAARMTTTAEGRLEDKVLIPYDNLLNGNGTVKVGRVIAIEHNKEGQAGVVVLSSGERVEYDILVLAPGSEWKGPLEFPDDHAAVLEHIETWRRNFENANTVILAGGSARGCEYAGEIKDAFPNKHVTIVHSQSQLLNSAYPDKYRKRVEKDLTSRGVTFIFNDRIDDFDSNPLTTRSGRRLDGDGVLVVPTCGGRPGTDFVRSLGPDVLNTHGQIKIERTFQLPSHRTIYAIGDVIDWEEQKQAIKAPKHAQIAAANILAQLGGGTPKKVYSGQPENIIISNGKKQGVSFMGSLGGIILGNWFSSTMKSKDLTISVTRRSYGLAN